MSLVREISILFSQNGLGRLNIDLFTNRMPETPDACGAIFQTAGRSPDKGFGIPGIQHEHPGLMIWFRGGRNDSEGPRVKAETAYRLLNTVQGQTIDGTLYLIINVLQAPYALALDNTRTTWSFNCLVDKELSVNP